MNFADTPNVTFSLGSADGLSLYRLPDGRRVDRFGLVAALASLSARQVTALGLTISGISGQPGSISSASAALQESLESRLQARLRTYGSISYKLTWKAWDTPSGVSRFRLRASAPRTSGIATTGSLPTPVASEIRDRARPEVLARADKGGANWTLDLREILGSPYAPGRGHPQPLLRRMDDGFSDAVGGLHAFGNAIVPQAAAEFVMAYTEAIGWASELLEAA